MLQRRTLRFTFLLIAIGHVIGLSAQDLIRFEDHNGVAVANGALLAHVDSTLDGERSVGMKVVLSGGDAKDIGLKQYILELAEGAGHLHCWGTCSEEQLAGAEMIAENEEQHIAMSVDSLHADFLAVHLPNGIRDVAKYRYVWYDLNNPTDSAWLDIDFVTDSTDLKKPNGPLLDFSVYPNPVGEDEITVSIALSSSDKATAIVLHNLVGEEVVSEQVTDLAAKVMIPLHDVDSGVYFVSVRIEDELVHSERLVIASP